MGSTGATSTFPPSPPSPPSPLPPSPLLEPLPPTCVGGGTSSMGSASTSPQATKTQVNKVTKSKISKVLTVFLIIASARANAGALITIRIQYITIQDPMSIVDFFEGLPPPHKTRVKINDTVENYGKNIKKTTKTTKNHSNEWFFFQWFHFVYSLSPRSLDNSSTARVYLLAASSL